MFFYFIKISKFALPGVKTTRSSHSAQYRRHQTYSDALKNSFSPELFLIGIVCLLLWPIPSPQRSLGHSLFKQKFSQRFLCFLCCFVFFVLFLFFYFIKISKFALPGVKTTRSSHSAQYRRHQTYSDALKNSFSPELFLIGIVCLLLWPIPSPQRSLGHSLFKQKFSQRFLCFLCFFFFFFFFFFYYFIKISKFALPGVMLKFERNQ